MKLEKLVEIANFLSGNSLSIIRYTDHWQVNSYSKDVEADVTGKSFRKAIANFIGEFGFIVEKKI